MIKTVKIVKAHASALYWKNRVAACEKNMRKNLAILETVGTGKHETEHGFFTVSENNTYPAEKIRARLTEKEIVDCMELKWSNSRAKVLFPIHYLAAKESHGFKVSI